MSNIGFEEKLTGAFWHEYSATKWRGEGEVWKREEGEYFYPYDCFHDFSKKDEGNESIVRNLAKDAKSFVYREAMAFIGKYCVGIPLPHKTRSEGCTVLIFQGEPPVSVCGSLETILKWEMRDGWSKLIVSTEAGFSWNNIKKAQRFLCSPEDAARESFWSVRHDGLTMVPSEIHDAAKQFRPNCLANCYLS